MNDLEGCDIHTVQRVLELAATSINKGNDSLTDFAKALDAEGLQLLAEMDAELDATYSDKVQCAHCGMWKARRKMGFWNDTSDRDNPGAYYCLPDCVDIVGRKDIDEVK